MCTLAQTFCCEPTSNVLRLFAFSAALFKVLSAAISAADYINIDRLEGWEQQNSKTASNSQVFEIPSQETLILVIFAIKIRF